MTNLLYDPLFILACIVLKLLRAFQGNKGIARGRLAESHWCEEQ